MAEIAEFHRCHLHYHRSLAWVQKVHPSLPIYNDQALIVWFRENVHVPYIGQGDDYPTSLFHYYWFY